MATKPAIEAMKDAIDEHGEVHLVLEEHDAEVELRTGTTKFNDDDEMVRVDGTDHTHYFDYDHVVRWYRPRSVFH